MEKDYTKYQRLKFLESHLGKVNSVSGEPYRNLTDEELLFISNYEETFPKKDTSTNYEESSVSNAMNTVNNALESSVNFGRTMQRVGKGIKEKALELEIDKKENWLEYKKGIEATLLAAELTSGIYGLYRGGAHLNSYLARKAATSTGLPISREAMLRAAQANLLANKVDKAQGIMSGTGLLADIGQREILGDKGTINNLEIVGGLAGLIGATNWFRGLPVYTKFGNTIDNVLDGAGYTAAGYDVVNDGNKIVNTIIDKVDPLINKEKEKAEGGKLTLSTSDIERNNINMLKYTGNLPLVRYDNGGKLWKDLSMRERALLIRNHVRNTFANGGSITDINIEDIRHRFDIGGNFDLTNIEETIKQLQQLPSEEKILENSANILDLRIRDKINNSRPSLEDYLNYHRGLVTEKAFDYSNTRTSPSYIMQDNPYKTKEEWEKAMDEIIKNKQVALLNSIKKNANQPPLILKMIVSIALQDLDDAIWEKDLGYSSKIPANSCLTTATDDYVLVTGDKSYGANLNSYFLNHHPGYEVVDGFENAHKGDIVQLLEDNGIAKHAMIYAGKNDLGLYIFNNSNGGPDDVAYKTGLSFHTLNTAKDPNKLVLILRWIGNDAWNKDKEIDYNYKYPTLANGGTLIHLYGNGGDSQLDESYSNNEETYLGILPFKEIVVYPSQELLRLAAVKRALRGHYDIKNIKKDFNIKNPFKLKYSYGGHIFDGNTTSTGQMSLKPSNFRYWDYKDSSYKPSDDDKFEGVNWSALDNNLLYIIPGLSNMENDVVGIEEKALHDGLIFDRDFIDTYYKDPSLFNEEELSLALAVRQPLANLSRDMRTNLRRAEANCLKSLLNWNSNKMPMFGIDPLRKVTEKFWLPSYKNGAYQMMERDRDTGEYNLGEALSSWNFARTMSDAGYGEIIDLTPYNGNIDYTKYPIGTIFNIGNAAKSGYIKGSTVDENGNPYPSHSYSIAGYAKDPETGEIKPLINDLGTLGFSTSIHLGESPTYAFIPNGYSHLTAANIYPRYEEYLNSMKADQSDINALAILGEAAATKLFILSIDPEELSILNRTYGVNRALLNKILLRLMAIGALESELGYTLEGEGYNTLASKWNALKWGLGDDTKTFIKNLTRGKTPETEEEIKALELKLGAMYDTKAGWEHEMEIYQKLLESGAFKNKTKELIQKLVYDAYNKEREVWNSRSTALMAVGMGITDELTKDTYGKLPPNIRTISEENAKNSHGAFLMKRAPMSYKYDENGKPIKGSEYNIDDLYQGDNETLKAYNRFLSIYNTLKVAYPDLNEEQLINAATISWNAPSKTKSPEFIDFYIKNQLLPDSYLSKILKHQSRLYPTKKSYGGHLFDDGDQLQLNTTNGTAAITPEQYAQIEEYNRTMHNQKALELSERPILILPDGTLIQGYNVSPLQSVDLTVAEYSPLGDLMDAASAVYNFNLGNYMNAAIGAGLVLMPEGVSAIGKRIANSNFGKRFILPVIDKAQELLSKVENVNKTTSSLVVERASEMPIGTLPNSISPFSKPTEELEEAYKKAIAIDPAYRTPMEEKVISDYSALLADKQGTEVTYKTVNGRKKKVETLKYGPGYKTNDAEEILRGYAPDNEHSFTAVALDLNKPYKDGTKELADGWYLNDKGEPYFDLARFINEKLNDPNIDFVNLSGNSELNPYSHAMYLQALLRGVKKGEWKLIPVRSKNGTLTMLLQNNWNASRVEPNKKTGKNMTLEEKMTKQEKGLKSDSAYIRTAREITGLTDLPYPARVKGSKGINDMYMLPSYAAVRIKKAEGGKLFDDGGQEETIPEWITKSKLDTMYSNSALRSYLAKYWASKKWTDEDIDYFYDKLINNETKWDPRTIVYAMAHESSFNPKANPGTTSASGLGLLTKDTVKTLYPDTWEEVWDLYSNNNRSIKDLLDDAFANYARIGNAISKDTDLMGYGRLKVNLLSPSKGLDDIVPDYMWDLGSLTKALQKQLVKGKSTYRDLMNMYNKEFLNYWDNDYRNPDYDPVNSDNPLQLPWYNVLWDNIKTQFGLTPPEGKYDF